MEYVLGLLYEYYHICQRKLWYFANGISMESENEYVQIGKLIDETSYERERKHILIDDRASIDFLRDNTVYEIKKSSAEKHAAIAQIKYYLYVLHEKGVSMTGELRIPKEHIIEKVSLNEADLNEIKMTIEKIEALISEEDIPPKTENTKICKSCAFYELCYI